MTTLAKQDDVMRNAARYMVPGVASLHRVIGRGAYEVTAQGAEVRLSDGRTIIDFGSYAVMLFGHRSPSVVSAVKAALDGLPTSTRVLANPHSVRLAERLVGMLAPELLSRVLFGLNGSDVVEAALKLAIAETGRPSVLAVEGAFHGKSLGALAVTADPDRCEPVRGFLGSVRHVALRAEAVSEALREAPAAAFIFEPVQGEGGGRELPVSLLRRWCADARAAGAFVIADEIQVGLRRCGPVSLSLDRGLSPDAILFGKALGGGLMPLSALVCTPRMFGPMIRDPFFHTATFAGHPLACAAGLAALDLLDEITDQARQTGKLLADGIAAIAAAHPGTVRQGRAIGLFGVLELGSPELANLVLLECARRGLLVSRCLSVPDVLRVLPPADTPEPLMTRAIGILDAACTASARRTGNPAVTRHTG